MKAVSGKPKRPALELYAGIASLSESAKYYSAICPYFASISLSQTQVRRNPSSIPTGL